MPRRSEYNDGYEGWGDSNFFGNDRKKQTDRHQTFCRKSELHYYPHYTDHYYKEARTIFGEKEDGLSTIIQIDYNNGTLKNHNEHGNSQKIAVKPPVLLISIKNIYLHTMTEKLY